MLIHLSLQTSLKDRYLLSEAAGLRKVSREIFLGAFVNAFSFFVNTLDLKRHIIFLSRGMIKLILRYDLRLCGRLASDNRS